MKCPFCGSLESQVKDSRLTEDNACIRRRRECPECGSRFTTFERVMLRELVVVKKNGEKMRFDRDKLARSIQLAVRKRPITPERVDKIVTSIQRRLESSGEAEISSTIIGEYAMEALANLDKVAYIRFASVYKDFCEPSDFEEFVNKIDELAKAKSKEEE
ncbi:MAG: transcriptional repressor NrdR [Alphaproteobacteria bacterium]|jgi:transcriptional repressor NrdR|nr:transcriptional repressor NrdR [Alphaproteobacteria bacterium]